MYQVMRPAEREAAAIHRRRVLEEERRIRVHDPKLREMGIDKQAIALQVQEKQARLEQEKARELALDAQAVEIERQMIVMDREKSRIRREVAQLDDEYRRAFQNPEQRKEYDLNDPKGLSKDLPLGADEAGLGISSAQRFEGADSEEAERKRAQARQMRDWAHAQIAERNMRARAEAQADREYFDHVNAIDEKRRQLEEAQKEVKSDILHATSSFNRMLMEQKRERDRLKAEQETRDGLEEIRNMLDSDMLCERPGVAEAATRTTRGGTLRVDHYRGMSPEERARVREEQERQAREAEEAKRRAKEDEAFWADEQARQRRAALLAEREAARQRAAANRELQGTLLRQGDEHRAQGENLRRLYSNEASDEFFEQFGKHSR
eukprot:tig00020675_g12624.t1